MRFISSSTFNICSNCIYISNRRENLWYRSLIPMPALYCCVVLYRMNMIFAHFTQNRHTYIVIFGFDPSIFSSLYLLTIIRWVFRFSEFICMLYTVYLHITCNYMRLLLIQNHSKPTR